MSLLAEENETITRTPRRKKIHRSDENPELRKTDTRKKKQEKRNKNGMEDTNQLKN